MRKFNKVYCKSKFHCKSKIIILAIICSALLSSIVNLRLLFRHRLASLLVPEAEV